MQDAAMVQYQSIVSTLGSPPPYDEKDRLTMHLFWLHTETRGAIARHIVRMGGRLCIPTLVVEQIDHAQHVQVGMYVAP